MNAELKEKGYTPVTNADYVEACAYLLNLDQEGMEEVINDTEMPMVMRIQARRILDENKGFEALQVIADRAHGRPTQKQELSGPDGGAVTFVLQAPEGVEVNIKQDD